MERIPPEAAARGPAHGAALAVLALCASIALLSRGIGETFAIFLLPIAREFATDRASLTSIYSVYMLTLGFMSPVVGTVFDRFGPRACYGVGLATYALTCALASRASTLWQLHALLGAGAAVGASMIGMLPASSLASRWFAARLSTAMGILSASLGSGILVFAPIAQALIERLGWRGAYLSLGAGLAAATAVVLVLPWKRIAAGSPDSMRARVLAVRHADTWTIRRALGTRLFWALTGVMFFTSVSTYAVSVQLVAYLVEAGIAPLRAASTYGLVGMVSIVGMVGAGMLAERIGELRVAMISYGATIAGTAALAAVANGPQGFALAAFVLLFGTMQGSRGPLVAVMCARHFAGGHQTGIYGAILVGMGAGGALGSWGSGALYDLTGGYLGGFALSAAGAACGLAIFASAPGLRGGARRAAAQ